MGEPTELSSAHECQRAAVVTPTKGKMGSSFGEAGARTVRSEMAKLTRVASHRGAGHVGRGRFWATGEDVGGDILGPSLFNVSE